MIYSDKFSPHLAQHLEFVDREAPLRIDIEIVIPASPRSDDLSEEEQRLIVENRLSRRVAEVTDLAEKWGGAVTGYNRLTQMLHCQLTAAAILRVVEHESVATIQLSEPLSPKDQLFEQAHTPGSTIEDIIQLRQQLGPS